MQLSSLQSVRMLLSASSVHLAWLALGFSIQPHAAFQLIALYNQDAWHELISHMHIFKALRNTKVMLDKSWLAACNSSRHCTI